MKSRKPSKPINAIRMERIATHYLARYAGTSASLRRVLLKRVRRSAQEHDTDPEVGKAQIETLIERFEASGLLNDGAFALSRARSLHRRGISRRAIRARLRQKGVGEAEVSAALLALAEEAGDAESAELAAAEALARRRRLGPYRRPDAPELSGPEHWARRKKELGVLARAGFNYGIAKQIIDREV